MSWIKTVDRPNGNKSLRDTFDKIRESRGKISNIMKAQSLLPDALKHHLNLYQSLMFGESSLKVAEREMIALVVSASNNCAYSVSHVADALAHYEKDNNRMKEIIAGRQFLGMTDRQAKMLRYATKLTQQPDAGDLPRCVAGASHLCANKCQGLWQIKKQNGGEDREDGAPQAWHCDAARGCQLLQLAPKPEKRKER